MSTKVGLMTVIGLLILAMAIAWKSNLLRSPRGYELTGTFQDIGGIIEGSDVRFRGKKVGFVTYITPDVREITAKIWIRSHLKIPRDSYLRVAFDGLIGQKYIEIVPGESQELLPIPPREPLNGFNTRGIVDFVHIGSKNLEESLEILHTLREIITDPKVKRDLKGTVTNLSTLVEQMTEAAHSVANIAAENRVVLKETLRNIRSVTYEMADLTEMLGSETSKKDIRTIMKNIREASENTKQVSAALAALANDPEVSADLKQILRASRKTLESANKSLSQAANLQLSASTDILAGNTDNTVRTNMKLQTSPEHFYEASIGELNGRIQLIDALLGKQINPSFAVRLGSVEGRPGGGLDYIPWEYLKLSGDIYGFNDENGSSKKPNLRLRLGYQLTKDFTFLAWYNNIAQTSSSYYLGLKVHH